MLAINTAFMTANLALSANGMMFVRDIDAKSKHSENVLKTIDDLCNDAKIDIIDIDTLSVVLGPGSFTGLRIGTAIAKALGSVKKDLKFVGVSSLELMAYIIVKNKLNKGSDFVCVLNALSDLFFVCKFNSKGIKIGDERMIDKAEFGALNMPIFALKDDMPKYELDEIETSSLDLLEFSEKKANNGDFCRLEEIVPSYLRASQAEDNLKNIKKDNKIS